MDTQHMGYTKHTWNKQHMRHMQDEWHVQHVGYTQYTGHANEVGHNQYKGYTHCEPHMQSKWHNKQTVYTQCTVTCRMGETSSARIIRGIVSCAAVTTHAMLLSGQCKAAWHVCTVINYETLCMCTYHIPSRQHLVCGQ
jgi:hypothetical protein